MDVAMPETVGLSSSRLARIGPAMQALIDAGRYVGISTLVYRHGQVAWFANQGSGTLDTPEPLAPDALFRIFSMTKPVVSVAALMLWERGLFGLDDPLADYLPAFARPKVLVDVEDGEPITEPAACPIAIRHLSTHTAGLGYNFMDDAQGRLYRDAGLDIDPFGCDMPMSRFLELLSAQPLAFHPGASWRYGLSHDVLGALVEVVSGQPLGRYLREHVLGPLGMADTGFWVPEDKAPRLTTLYSGATGELAVEDDPATSPLLRETALASGGSGLVSTMRDYLRFARLLLGGGMTDGVRLLGRQTVALMASNHLAGPSLAAFQAGRPGKGYGLGVSITLELSRDRTHSTRGDFGWSGGASTWFRVDPAEDMIVMIMSQVVAPKDWAHCDRFRALTYAALV